VHLGKIDLEPHSEILRIAFALVHVGCLLVNWFIKGKINRAGAISKVAALRDEQAWKEEQSKSRKRPNGDAAKEERKYFEQTVVAKKSPDWGEDEVETEMT
jgi:hypothetical protein